MDEKDITNLIHRLNRIQGQIEALKRNLKNTSQKDNCKDMIHQTKAVYKAIKKFSEKYTSLHINNCLKNKNNNLEKELKDAISIAFKM